MTRHKILSSLAVVAALIAAGLWFYASTIPVPTDIKSGYGSLVGVEEMSAGLQKQGFWNAVAAAMMGAAVLLDLVTRVSPGVPKKNTPEVSNIPLSQMLATDRCKLCDFSSLLFSLWRRIQIRVLTR